MITLVNSAMSREVQGEEQQREFRSNGATAASFLLASVRYAECRSEARRAYLR